MRPLKALGIGVLCYLLLTTAAGVYLAEGLVRPWRRPTTSEDRDVAARLAGRGGGRLEDVSIESDDGVRLVGWLFTPASPSGAVLVLHGQGNSRVGMLPYVEMLFDAGYAVLAIDARGHGDSGAALVTYGVREAADARRWASFLRGRRDVACVWGFGESMGAATMLQALTPDAGFCGAVVESPFATFTEVAYDRIGWMFGTGSWLGRTLFRPTIVGGFAYLRWRYGVDLDLASPLAALRRSTVPVLLIHGTVDRSIPARHSQLLEAARPERTTVWLVPGAEHCGARGVAPEEFHAKVLGAMRAFTTARN
jgi:uncharacterized protein